MKRLFLAVNACHPLDSSSIPVYITTWLINQLVNNYGFGQSQHYVRSACRSHAARDPGAVNLR
jgi:hypothetical protein